LHSASEPDDAEVRHSNRSPGALPVHSPQKGRCDARNRRSLSRRAFCGVVFRPHGSDAHLHRQPPRSAGTNLAVNVGRSANRRMSEATVTMRRNIPQSEEYFVRPHARTSKGGNGVTETTESDHQGHHRRHVGTRPAPDANDGRATVDCRTTQAARREAAAPSGQAPSRNHPPRGETLTTAGSNRARGCFDWQNP